MAWTRAQQLALAMAPKVSSVFSLFGSTWIVVEVLTHNKGRNPKRRQPYHRLLLAMSIYDILESIWNFASTWPIPLETEDVHNPVGTTATCTAQGFFLTLGIAVPIYNAFLSLYYLLVIRYRYTEATLKQRVEPTMHIVSFVFAFGTAATSSFMGLINNANLWCWIAPYPGDCLDSRRYPDDADCERGDNAWIYRWAFYFAPLWFCILFATFCTLMVYQYVLSIEHRTVRYRRPQNALRSSVETNAAIRGEPGGTKRAERCDDEVSDMTGMQARGVDSAGNSSRQEARTKRTEDYRQTVEVFRQSLWYLGTFYITHVWSTSNRVIQQLNNGKTFFAVIALHSWFDPLQGFLNFVVYQRPRYFKVRKDNPEKGRLAAIGIVLRFSFLPESDAVIRTSSNTPSPPRSQDTGVNGIDSLCSRRKNPILLTAADMDRSFSDISEDLTVPSTDHHSSLGSQSKDERSMLGEYILPPAPSAELLDVDVDSLDGLPSSDESGDRVLSMSSSSKLILQRSSPGIKVGEKLDQLETYQSNSEESSSQIPSDVANESGDPVKTNSSDKSRLVDTKERTILTVDDETNTIEPPGDGMNACFHDSKSADTELRPTTAVSSSDWYFRFL